MIARPLAWARSLWRGLRWRADVEIEVDEEFRLHIEMRMEDLVRSGLPPAEARRRAHIEFGSVERYKEEGRASRGLAPFDWLSQDVGYALRGMRRAPGFAAMFVVTLALGVGGNAAVFSLLDRVFAQNPAGVARPEELRRLYTQIPDGPTEPGGINSDWNWPAFAAVREGGDGAARLVAWTQTIEGLLRHDARELDVLRSMVTHDYFEVLGVPAALGRVFGPDEQRVEVPTPVVVLSYTLWESAFARDRSVVGQTFEINDETLTIIGVASEGFAGLELNRTDVFQPVNMVNSALPLGEDPFYVTDGDFFRVAARLNPGADEQQLEDRATAVRRAYRVPHPEWSPSDSDARTNVLTGSIIEARGPQGVATQQSQTLSVGTRAIGVTGMVLLITCANVAGLLLVRAMRRRRELAVRLALGVSRARLLSQMIVEGLVLASIAGLAAVFVAAWGGSVLRRLMMPDVQWAEPALDSRTIAVAFITAALIGVVAGMTPAFEVKSTNLTRGLRGGVPEGGAPRSWARAILLVAQGALSVVLLVGAGLFVRSLGNLGSLPVGYEVDELASVRVARGSPITDQHRVLAQVADGLASLPGVSGVALANWAPMEGASGMRVYLPVRDSPPRSIPGASYNRVSPEFFRVTGLDIVAGRGLEAGDPWDVSIGGIVVVNETMARTFWPGESALGQCIILGGADRSCSEVVGVVEDARSRVIAEATPQFFIPLVPDTPSPAVARSIVIRVDRDAWANVAAEARTALEPYWHVREMGSGPREGAVRTAHYSRLAESLAPQLRPWRLGAQLFTAFGVLALIVTAVGIYSVMAYTVSQRTHEIGVRIALGARVKDVLRLVMSEGLVVILLGIAVGIAIALAMGKLVASLLFGVTPHDPVAMAMAAVVLLAVGLIACLVPALRAARVDPVEALLE